MLNVLSATQASMDTSSLPATDIATDANTSDLDAAAAYIKGENHLLNKFRAANPDLAIDTASR